MSEWHCVIIGNGSAGNMAAQTLRRKAPECRVTIISKELHHYYRPHLLPAYICGQAAQKDLYVNPLSWYKDLGITLRLGQPVVSVDVAGRSVILEHKERIRFDGLIIAVGAKPVVPEHLRRYADMMLTLKTLADATVWMEKLANANSVLIVGGDLTSLSFTRSLIQAGKRVLFVASEHCFWPVRVTPDAYEQMTRRLQRHGVEIVPGTEVLSVSRTGDNRFQVQTRSATATADLVGAFYGLAPDIGFLKGCGLDMERGILVDEYLQTRVEGVYAAGDCAQVYHPELRDYWVPIGYGNANTLGRVAAMNLVGRRITAEVPAESIIRVDGINLNVSWWMEF